MVNLVFSFRLQASKGLEMASELAISPKTYREPSSSWSSRPATCPWKDAPARVTAELVRFFEEDRRKSKEDETHEHQGGGGWW
jgi:hypothetical protein